MSVPFLASQEMSKMPTSGICNDGTAVEASRLAMSRMMAVAGHDLKQPIQVAMLCMEKAVEEGVTKKAAHLLRTAVEAMGRLSSELNDIARLSQMHSVFPKRRVVRMTEVLSRIGREWRMHAHLRRINLTVCRSDHLVRTDPEMLYTILRNFLDNALKYSEAGGHIRVICRAAGDNLRVDVEDDGCGIAPGVLDRIFDAFERGDQSDHSDGLGLGLLIAHQTAGLLRHRISVRSVQDSGSRFSVEVPLHFCDAGRAQAGATKDETAAHREHA
ncbi:HAMP domain-containing histidine kinase [Bradyrhizobium sp. NBAIM03]|nr:HAMP domain-containing histidine kinase [Bradyrhizobium sp. NBAIM03]